MLIAQLAFRLCRKKTRSRGEKKHTLAHSLGPTTHKHTHRQCNVYELNRNKNRPTDSDHSTNNQTKLNTKSRMDHFLFVRKQKRRTY